ncbi:MAG: hypothetical protein KAT12_04700 [Gammaproteobacteria bacterium]|nr:hypothetical protein [Gammaproteobacteria bacterium]
MQQNVNLHSIMGAFAETTGLTDTSHDQRRYLWTDAFAVCNYLELYRQTGDEEDLQLALKLVEQVHLTLGKHHKDSKHSGWLSGLDEEQARLHPTIAGLRIGKQLNERQTDEAYDDQLEWDRDGQYFHYLTKWMHALNRVSQVTGKSIYNRWARELAHAAHAAFTYTPVKGGLKRMYWKMSTDLSHAQIPSMGQHDPLDGLITYLQLKATAKSFPAIPGEPDLKAEIEDMQAMCSEENWATEDPLGIGGLLSDAYRLVQLIDTHQLHETTRLESLLHDVEISLQAFINNNQLNLPAEYRLAFRELGLAIGLHTIARMQKTIGQHPENFTNADQLNTTLSKLIRFHRIKEFSESFWLEPEHRSVNSWLEHADINNVMLATCLAPDSYLKI